MAEDTTRGLDVAYDVDAFPDAAPVGTFADTFLPYLVYIIMVLFPIAGLTYIFWPMIKEHF